MHPMITLLGPYVQPIFGALIAFPFLAGALTLPYCVINYRRYGGIAAIRTFVFFSFVLYCLCAFLLTVLPLPDIRDVAASDPIPINFIPGSNLIEGMADFGLFVTQPISLLQPKAWAGYLMSRQLFQLLANVIMLVPMGFFLRYFFEFSLRKTLLISFLTSLFFELTQLSGLYGIYPHAYRCPDVDDLICNTLGGLIGFYLAPLLARFLPTKDEIDLLSWKAGSKVSPIREWVAACADLCIVGVVSTSWTTIWDYVQLQQLTINFNPTIGPISVFLYFCLLQKLLHGQTPGKMIMRIRLVTEDGSDKLPIPSMLIRYGLLYFVVPLVASINILAAGSAVVFAFYEPGLLKAIGIITCLGVIVLTVLFTLGILKKSHRLPHDHFSHTRVVVASRPDAPNTPDTSDTSTPSTSSDSSNGPHNPITPDGPDKPTSASNPPTSYSL